MLFRTVRSGLTLLPNLIIKSWQGCAAQAFRKKIIHSFIINMFNIWKLIDQLFFFTNLDTSLLKYSIKYIYNSNSNVSLVSSVERYKHGLAQGMVRKWIKCVFNDLHPALKIPITMVISLSHTASSKNAALFSSNFTGQHKWRWWSRHVDVFVDAVLVFARIWQIQHIVTLQIH